MTQSSDSQLIHQIQSGDTAAFEELFARYRPVMQSHIARIVREPAATEDLVQEVFLRLWTRAEQWQGSGSAKGWLYRIATNLSLNHLRSVKRRPQQPLEIHTDDSDDDNPVPGWMVDASALTPEAQPVIVRHCHVSGLSPDEMNACVVGSREGLAHFAKQWDQISQITPAGSDHTKFSVLARARRSQHPGVVFARAAAIGERDPLSDIDSRLFVGLSAE